MYIIIIFWYAGKHFLMENRQINYANEFPINYEIINLEENINRIREVAGRRACGKKINLHKTRSIWLCIGNPDSFFGVRWKSHKTKKNWGWNFFFVSLDEWLRWGLILFFFISIIGPFHNFSLNKLIRRNFTSFNNLLWVY